MNVEAVQAEDRTSEGGGEIDETLLKYITKEKLKKEMIVIILLETSCNIL